MLYRPERFKPLSLAPKFHTVVLSRAPVISSNKYKRIFNAKDSPKRNKADEEQLVHTDEEDDNSQKVDNAKMLNSAT
jgi:hypothetical protein